MLDAAEKAFHEEQKNFLRSHVEFNQCIPEESTFELQYMLNHLLKAGTVGNEFADYQADCIRRATGHLRRAHLDYLKFALIQLYGHIEACHPEHISPFLKSFLPARLLEFGNIGSSQDAAIDAYRKTLAEFIPKAQLKNLTVFTYR